MAGLQGQQGFVQRADLEPGLDELLGQGELAVPVGLVGELGEAPGDAVEPLLGAGLVRLQGQGLAVVVDRAVVLGLYQTVFGQARIALGQGGLDARLEDAGEAIASLGVVGFAGEHAVEEVFGAVSSRAGQSAGSQALLTLG